MENEKFLDVIARKYWIHSFNKDREVNYKFLHIEYIYQNFKIC